MTQSTKRNQRLKVKRSSTLHQLKANTQTKNIYNTEIEVYLFSLFDSKKGHFPY